MSEHATPPSVEDSAIDHPFSTGNLIVTDTDNGYRVVQTYEGYNGQQMVKLRAIDSSRSMYRPVYRLQQCVRDGDWLYEFMEPGESVSSRGRLQ